MLKFISDIYYPERERLIKNLEEKNKSKYEIKKIVGEFDNEVLPELAKTIINDMITYHKEKMHEEVQYEFHEDDIFVARNMQKWSSAFAASRTMYHLCIEIAENYSSFMATIDEDDKKPIQYLFVVIQSLHGRACQTFLEILSLMRNGFPDGAYSRFRCLYELAVIAAFICENGEKVAKEYYKCQLTKNDNYQWAKAAECFKSKDYITFNKIQKEQAAFTNVWLPQYKLGCEITHATSRATFARLGNWEGMTPCIPVGQSDHGMSTPGEHSAIIIAAITNTFLSIYQTIDSLALGNVVRAWINIVREHYFKIAYERDGNNDVLDWLKENVEQYKEI